VKCVRPVAGDVVGAALMAHSKVGAEGAVVCCFGSMKFQKNCKQEDEALPGKQSSASMCAKEIPVLWALGMIRRRRTKLIDKLSSKLLLDAITPFIEANSAWCILVGWYQKIQKSIFEKCFTARGPFVRSNYHYPRLGYEIEATVVGVKREVV
jgi:hypothetical protein